jgi:shikimate dehydrogenase
MSLTSGGRIAGIVGWPVAHSLSPQLHAHWLREHGIDGAYVPLPVVREEFARVMAALRRAGFVGVNVTVPHKEAAFAIAHEVDDVALAAGAVNLLLFRGDRIIGRNTDVDGLVASLAEALGSDALHGNAVAVLGAGGAARAAVLAGDRLRARSICIVGRQVGRAESLVGTLKSHIKAELTTLAWSGWSDAAPKIDLLVNATSGGMRGAAPLALDIGQLRPGAAVCDLVYNPLDTDLIKAARARGHLAIDGLGMLMHQAVPSFEVFFGVRPTVSAALRTELEEVLRHAG